MPTGFTTTEEVREWLDYDPATGILTWKKSRSGHRNSHAGGYETTGYGRVMFRRRRYMVTCIIWAWVHGVWPTQFIDHIDRNPKNNRLTNLREATARQNQANRQHPKNKTGFLGVTARSSGKSFVAIVKVNSKSTYLGTFATAKEAAAVVRAKRFELHGEFAT